MKHFLAGGSLLVGLLALVLMNAGCVSTTLTLSSNHPARAGAPSGRVESEPAAILRPDAPSNSSGTLAATSNRGDRQPALPSESSADAPEPEGKRDAPYVGQGVIEGIGETQLEIQHEIQVKIQQLGRRRPRQSANDPQAPGQRGQRRRAQLPPPRQTSSQTGVNPNLPHSLFTYTQNL